MDNELIFISIITGLLLPVYFMYSTYYIENKKVYWWINLGAVCVAILVWYLFSQGAFRFEFSSFFIISFIAIISTPQALMLIYAQRKMLVQSFENRKKYYLYPILLVSFLVGILNIFRFFLLK